MSDLLNTPFNNVLNETREAVRSHPAVAHAVAFLPESRELAVLHGEDYNLQPEAGTVFFRFEGEDIDAPSFREAFHQAKTDVLRNVERPEKRFAHLG